MKLLSTFLLCVIGCSAVFAETIALVPDLGDGNEFSLRPGDGATRGWLFSVLDPIVVTQLGVYDDSGDGLMASHEVGIWEWTTQRLLVSATVPDGDQTVILDDFRYIDVPPTAAITGHYQRRAKPQTAGDISVGRKLGDSSNPWHAGSKAVTVSADVLPIRRPAVAKQPSCNARCSGLTQWQ